MSQTNLSPEMLSKIRMILGRDVVFSEKGSVDSFAEFSELDMEDFRSLMRVSGIFAVSYIRFKLKGEVELDTVVSYFSTVVQQGIPIQDWIGRK